MKLKTRPRHRAFAAAASAAAFSGWCNAASAADDTPLAQAPSPATPTNSARLPAVVVTGNPLRSAEVAAPTSVLGGDALVLRRGSTLGETLDGLPGVSASYFGPNANRPIVRGMDGDRIRVLSNSGVALDASSLSSDHAVPIDPLVIERVEVLRGPSALLYGGGAVGGVVNAIDNRIPRSAVDAPTGTAELRYGGPATERGASGILEAGGKGFAVHADAFYRKTNDMSVPEFARPVDGGGTELRSTIVNSQSQSEGGALGGSFVWDHGHAGASLDTYRSRYGTVVEEDVTIDMHLNKLTLAGEVRKLAGPIARVSAQWLGSDYQHQEIEGSGVVATTFKNRGSDFRIEFEQAKTAFANATLGGAFGLQGGSSSFSAIGDEAFVPSTDTRQLAAFVLQELTFGPGKLTLGGRLGHAAVDSQGDAAGQMQFGPPQSRSFTPGSAAIGGLLNIAPQWQLSGNLAYTERAPTFYELYANGFHVATGAYEVGDPMQAMERGSNLDLAVQWADGENNFIKAGVFANRFSNYIFLRQTGVEVPTADGPVPEFVFTGVRAKFEGAEVEGQWRVLEDKAQRLDLSGKFDLTRATDEDSGQPLPNIPPWRLTLGANWSLGPWAARAEVVHAAAQNRVPTFDPTTPSYTLVNLSASYRFELSGSDGFVFLKLNNLTNELAYNATTLDTVRALAPLPGRGLLLGLRLAF